MYEVSVPIFIHHLRNLSRFLRKGADQTAARNTNLEMLVETRLAPDMFTLGQQVRAAVYHASAAVANLTGRKTSDFDGSPVDLPALFTEIDNCISRLSAEQPAQFAGAASRTITLHLRRGPVSVDGQHYLTRFALPNFFFHVVTAYDILRHAGVEIGKADFLGALVD